MQASREKEQLLLTPGLGTRWGWVVSVTPRPLFTPGERTPSTHCTGGWVGPRAGLDTEVRGKFVCLCRGSNLGRPVCSQTLYSLSGLLIWLREQQKNTFPLLLSPYLFFHFKRLSVSCSVDFFLRQYFLFSLLPSQILNFLPSFLLLRSLSCSS
jgi:hypothetical protein